MKNNPALIIVYLCKAKFSTSLYKIFAGPFPLIIFLVLYFYLFPRMKQEYKTRGWSWKHYYDVCGDNNRLSYSQLFLQILKK